MPPLLTLNSPIDILLPTYRLARLVFAQRVIYTCPLQAGPWLWLINTSGYWDVLLLTLRGRIIKLIADIPVTGFPFIFGALVQWCSDKKKSRLTPKLNSIFPQQEGGKFHLPMFTLNYTTVLVSHYHIPKITEQRVRGGEEMR